MKILWDQQDGSLGKGTCCQARWPDIYSLYSYVRRRKLVTISCSLIYTHVQRTHTETHMCAYIRMCAETCINKNVRKNSYCLTAYCKDCCSEKIWWCRLLPSIQWRLWCLSPLIWPRVLSTPDLFSLIRQLCALPSSIVVLMPQILGVGILFLKLP